MRIHVYEFVTGGGLAGAPLPPSLLREGALMRDALLADLVALDGVEPSVAVDGRCSLPPWAAGRMRTWRRDPGRAEPEALRREVDAADAAWIIAPETDGVLERAAAQVLAAGRTLLGARPAAIAIAASKSRTAARLAAHGIAAAPVLAPADALASAGDGAWALKPDDGAGCVDTWHCADRHRLRVRVAGAAAGIVAQRWVDGDALRRSAFAGAGGVALLAVNRQHLAIDGERIRLAALDVNAVRREPVLQRLAAAVAAALPGLDGCFGIDLVRAGDAVTVIEVNPRLTTSFAGLRRARSINVAALALGRPQAAVPVVDDMVRVAL